MAIKEKNLFLFTLFITIIARAMTWYESSINLYTPILLAYLLFWTLGLIVKKDISFVPGRKTRIILVSLTLYSIFFCFSNIKELDITDTINVMLRSLMNYYFCFITILWINKYRCYNKFLSVIFTALALLMMILFILNMKNINLKATLSTFWSNDGTLRTRTLFGFSAPNIAAEYALSVILLSLIQKKRNVLVSFVYFFIDVIMLIIIVANNSRGTLIAFIFISIVYLALKFIRFRSSKRVCKMLVLGALAVFFGFGFYLTKHNLSFDVVLENTNRMHFLDNLDALIAGNRWFLGLGNISGLSFQKGYIIYGVKLNYMEIFYIGIFICSGIIGSIWMIYNLVFIMKGILNKSSTHESKFHKWIFLIYCYMLFLSLFEGYLFSSSYITATIYLCSILMYIDSNQYKKKYCKKQYINGRIIYKYGQTC